MKESAGGGEHDSGDSSALTTVAASPWSKGRSVTASAAAAFTPAASQLNNEAGRESGGGMRGRLLMRELALADGTSASLQLDMAIAVQDGRIAWLGSADEADPAEAEIVDGSGATLVPALVDCHSHLSGPGGAHCIERFNDAPERLRPLA